MSYYVYHICKEGSSLSDGYIGISTEPKNRWVRHKAPNSDSNPLLKRAIRKYKPSFKIIAVFDTLEGALWQEYTLRPFDRMGWNLIRGGGLPPSMGGWNKGKKTKPESLKKMSEARLGRFKGHKHPRARPVDIFDYKTDELIASDVVVTQWAKENNYHQAHLTATATGKLKQHKGVYARYVENVERPSPEKVIR